MTLNSQKRSHLTEGPQHPQGGDPKHVLILFLLPQTFTPKLVLLDLSDISCVQDVAKEVLDCYGCVDILINNASVKVKGPAHKIALELDKKIMDANYFGPITFTKGPARLIFLRVCAPPDAMQRPVVPPGGHLVLDRTPTQESLEFER